MNAIRIHNNKAVADLSIKLEGRGGVCVLQGPNGAGKSSSLTAVNVLAGTAPPTALEMRDGELDGYVEGFGRHVTIGLGRKRNIPSGEFEATTLDSSLDPSVIVDPGMKDVAAADWRRIQMLCRLGGVTADPQAFEAVMPGILAFASHGTLALLDLPEQSASLKRDLEARARDAARDADGVEADVRALELTVADVVMEGPTLAEAKADVERSQTALSDLRAQARAAQAAQKAVDAASKLIQDSSQDVIDAARETAKKAEDAERAAGEEVAARKATFDAARENLRRAEERFRAVGVDATAAKAARDRADDLARRRAEAQRAIAEASEVRGPAPEALAEAEAEASAAVSGQIEAERRQRARETLEKIAEKRSTAASSRELEAGLRVWAGRCEEVVTAAMARVGVAGTRVLAGRLVVEHGARGTIPFDEESFGERWKRILPACIRAVGEGGVFTIRQEAWEGLQPANRMEIAEAAEAAGVWIFTAKAEDGELRASKYEGERDGQADARE